MSNITLKTLNSTTMENTHNAYTVCNQMRSWFDEKNYAGIDPYLLDEKVFRFRQFPVLGTLVSCLRRALKPFHSYVPPSVFSSYSPVIMPKALGLILSGVTYLYETNEKDEYIEEGNHLLELLETHCSPGFKHLCWGQPFAWGGTPRYPPDTPAVCVTSPIGHGIMDYYAISRDKKALDMLVDVAQYLLFENGYEDFGDSICLHYSPNNPELVYNSNIMAASLLLRISEVTNEESLYIFASKAVNFILEGQNANGSWYYTDPRGKKKVNKMIDNRHSGFVLEHMAIAEEILKREDITRSKNLGWKYYEKYLFDGQIPKWSPTQTFPVDIHDIAQAIITLVRMREVDFASEVVQYALNNMFDGYNQFYYKLFEDGRFNRTVFIRWGQAWMFKALGLYSKTALLVPQEQVGIG